MSIWFQIPTLEDLNRRGNNTLSDFFGIEFIDITDDSLSAIMPVTKRNKQPIGLLHGGANVALAETVASTAANMVVDISKCYCVGLEINANHVRSVREGTVRAITHALHIGRNTQVWEIKIFNEANKLSCISRMTASVLQR